MSDIHIFICENDDAAAEIIEKYFKTGAITCASIVDSSKRQEIIAAIDKASE